MKPEKQRIALAEACGWKWWTHGTAGGFAWLLKGPQPADWFVTSRPKKLNGLALHAIPDYLNDLDAIAQVEDTLTTIQWIEYAKRLRKHHTDYPVRAYGEIGAKASQRAEFLLRTLNLWEEE